MFTRQLELSFFEGARIELLDAEVVLFPDYFSRNEADGFFETFMNEVRWRQDYLQIYGKKVKLPRETAWYGDQGKSYAFSGIELDPNPWIDPLIEVKSRIERVSGADFNSVLLNRYRDGNDSVSWHSDAEPELGKNPVIGSVSFGATRTFVLKHRRTGIVEKLELAHGSFLLMTGPTQHHWVHQVPKVPGRAALDVGPRVNLTFRRIISN